MNQLAVYRVTLTSRHPRSGEPFFINFECAHPTVADLVAELNEGRIVAGTALFTRKSARDEHQVVKRKAFALGRHGAAHIEPPDFRFVEYEGEVEHVGC